MTCPYKEKCWRRAYTRYLKDGGVYGKTPPSRASLFFWGYATSNMLEFKERANGTRNYHSSIFAEVFPQPDQPNTYCPIEESYSCENCHEYKKEQYNEKRRVQRKKEYESKYPNARKRVHIPEHIRREVSRRDKFTCVYCCRRYAHLKSKGIKCAIDHVIPLSKGGKEKDQGNLAFSCYECNREKSDEIWEFGCRVNYYGQ